MMNVNDYFKNDEYWSEHINKSLEEDLWIDEYKTYFTGMGAGLGAGAGAGSGTSI